METGTVCGVRLDKGYFFIRLAGSDDVFAHVRDLVDLRFDETLRHRRVRFELVTTDKGPRAKAVQPAD